MITKILRILLVLFNGFLALTAIAGGIGLLAGLNAPPVEMLAGSPFTSYIIPGLALLVIVGGVALIATLMLVRRHSKAVLASVIAGAVIIGFEIVEVLVIGSPVGIARNLQIFYSTLGILILVFTAAYWLAQRPTNG